MGEVILPFIEEDRLLSAIQPLLEKLNEDENERNINLTPILYTTEENPNK